MIFNVVSPIVATIDGDSLKDAIKNFIKINHNLNITEMIIRDQSNNVRANINYYKLSSDSSDDTRFTFKFANSSDDYVPQYSYNWPYDFFSLTELVNVEASLDLKKKI